MNVSKNFRWKIMLSITSIDVNFQGINPYRDDPMVITVKAKHFTNKKVLMDQGISLDILYWRTYKQLELLKEVMRPYDE